MRSPLINTAVYEIKDPNENNGEWFCELPADSEEQAIDEYKDLFGLNEFSNGITARIIGGQK
jgi:hypothetical protein